MQITASRDASGKSGGQVASRKKKLARHGAEKNAHGHRFRAQQDSYEGMNSIRAGSMNGEWFVGWTVRSGFVLTYPYVAYPFATEVALGGKTGQSRCLIDAAEREWKMTLPEPAPLSLLEGCSCLQLRNVTVGFAARPAEGEGEGKVSSPPSPVPSPVPAPAVSAPKAAPAVSSSLGSKKVRAVLPGATATAAAVSKATVCTMVLEGVTLDAHQKSKIAILGKNGCGKR